MFYLFLVVITYMSGCVVFYKLSLEDYRENNKSSEYRLTLFELLLILFWPCFATISIFYGLYYLVRGY